LVASSSSHGCITIRSSRSRFAARLNSGVSGQGRVMALLAIFLLFIGGVLAIAAFAVRFGGNTTVLTGLQPQAIHDMAALNRWAGNRLLLLPVAAFGFGIAGLRQPIYAVVGLAVLVVLGFAVIAWLMLGAERFRVAR
jgi:hypothetical protein